MHLDLAAGPHWTVGLLALGNLPSFDWQAALTVGVIVAVGVVAVTAIAIATPAVGIAAGATVLGTALTVGGIALAVGVVGGVAAGLHEGTQADLKHENQIVSIKSKSNQLHVRFLPSSGDAANAADFQCEVITYNEVDLSSRPPRVEQEVVQISAVSGTEFFSIFRDKLGIWFATEVLADRDHAPRQIILYMQPYPGEGVYEQIVGLVNENEDRKSEVQRVNGPWRNPAETLETIQ